MCLAVRLFFFFFYLAIILSAQIVCDKLSESVVIVVTTPLVLTAVTPTHDLLSLLTLSSVTHTEFSRRTAF